VNAKERGFRDSTCCHDHMVFAGKSAADQSAFALEGYRTHVRSPSVLLGLGHRRLERVGGLSVLHENVDTAGKMVGAISVVDIVRRIIVWAVVLMAT